MRGPAYTTPIALLVADLHLSHQVPAARSNEADWYAAQKRMLTQLADLAGGLQVPIFCAGDIFDRWNSPSELVNFALEWLPEMWAIPGNHDLPNHSYKDMRRSSFWTLVEARRVRLLQPSCPVTIPGRIPLTIHAFPYGFPMKRLTAPHDLGLEIAVTHQYVWQSKARYEGASHEQHFNAHRDSFIGYDVVAIGDNHQPWEYAGQGNTFVYNCGCLQRRRQDERHIKPSVGVLHADGTVTRQYLDISKDKFIDAEPVPTSSIDLSGVVEGLVSLKSGVVDFEASLRRLAEQHGLDEITKQAILQALEGGLKT